MPECISLVTSLLSKIRRKLRYFFVVTRYVLAAGAYSAELRPTMMPFSTEKYFAVCPSQPDRSVPLKRWIGFSVLGSLGICFADQSAAADSSADTGRPASTIPRATFVRARIQIQRVMVV